MGSSETSSEGPVRDVAAEIEAEQGLYLRINDGLDAAIRAAIERFGLWYAFDYLQGELDDLRLAWTGPRASPRRKRLTAAKRRRILERDAYRCRKCQGWYDLCIDHIVPIARGGSNEDENLQVLCRSCNSSKGIS